MTKSLKEVYIELNNLRELEEAQENYNILIKKSKAAKELINNNRCFFIEGTEDHLSNYVNEITKQQKKAELNLVYGIEQKVENSLESLFKDYMKAIESENKDGFIKHDVIMKIEIDKGYSLHLELLLKKINKNVDVNFFNKFGFEANEEEKRVVFLTMTGKDFIKVAELIKKEKEKTGVNFMPEASMLCVDTKKRTREEHNEALLSRMENYDDREYLPYIAERVGYFSHKQKFNWYTDNFEDFLKTNFVNSYKYSKALHNERLLNNGHDPENYIVSFKTVEYENPIEGYKKVSYNLFTEIEKERIAAEIKRVVAKTERNKKTP